ncbi:MAG: O-methyltransferase [Longimicrobiaceae bacterium]
MSVRDLLRDAVLWVRRQLALRRVARVTSGDDGLRRILRAVEQTLRGELSPEERSWIRRITELRRRLRASRDLVTPPDADPALAHTVGQRYLSSKSHLGALLLFHLVREFRPSRCLELGTNLGVSAAYQAAALALNGGGELHTIEGTAALVDLARRHLASLGLAAEVHAGWFSDVLPGLLARTAPLDHVFIDGHHDGPATVGYFAQIHPALGPGALVVFDDVAWSAGMAEAWRTIQADPRVRVAVGLGTMGVCLVGGEGEPVRIDLPIPG